jgi:septal ring-binding cell division protein DamX
MARRKLPQGKRDNRFVLELSIRSLFFYGSCLLVLLGWVFVLGILLGRGHVPEAVRTIAALKSQIARLEERVNYKRSETMDLMEKLDEDPKLAFYEKLSTKKEEVIDKTSQHQQDKKLTVKQEETLRDSGMPGAYTVQLASLESRSKAANLVNRLLDKGYPAYYHEASVKGKTYYRIRCGKFSSEKEAEEISSLLSKQEGLKGLILRVE